VGRASSFDRNDTIVTVIEKSADDEICPVGMYSRSAFDGKRPVQQIERLSEDPLGQVTDRESIEPSSAPFLQRKATAYPIWNFASISFAQESENLSDLALLQFYTKEWKRYTTGANYVNRLFAYLNRHWVKREKDEGRKGIYTVYTVSPKSLECQRSRYERLIPT
jgi:hypothetical protein